MKRTFFFILVTAMLYALNGSAQNIWQSDKTYQLGNPDFEAWTASSGEPDHWHGFKSAKGTLAGQARGTLAKQEATSSFSLRPATKGSNCGVITAQRYFVINNGTVTNGQLQAASMTADNVANHSEMDKSSTATDNNGDLFYSPIDGLPDSIAVWIKFQQGTASTKYPYATVSAIAFDGTFYQDPEDKTYTNTWAKAQNKEIAVTDWRRVAIPFVSTGNNVTPEALLVTISTNATPGQGSANDKVWFDDIEVIYTYELTLGKNGYATMCRPFQMFLKDDGVTAYTISSFEDKDGGMHPVFGKTYTKGQLIPANTPLIVKGTEGQTIHYSNYDISAASYAAAVTDNLLQAGTGSRVTDNDATLYKLAVSPDGNTVAFYLDDENGGHSVNVPVGKAYLRMPAGTSAKSFSLDGMTTGISITEQAEKQAKNDPYFYDLSGRQVGTQSGNLKSGIYVHGGKKVIIK